MQGKTADNKDPLAGIAEMIQAVQEQDKVVREENSRLNKLLEVQDQLIEKQRILLKEVAETSSELYEILEKMKELKQKLFDQKKMLLVDSSESSQASSIIDEVVSQQTPPPSIANSPSGNLALKAVEIVGKQIFDLTESCLKSNELSVPAESIRELLAKVNDVIEASIRSGNATESEEDQIRRQSFIISALVPQPEEE